MVRRAGRALSILQERAAARGKGRAPCAAAFSGRNGGGSTGCAGLTALIYKKTGREGGFFAEIVVALLNARLYNKTCLKERLHEK